MKDATDCIFCDIIKGKGDAAIVYSDESFIAFMDHRPITKGHTLVLPKKHYYTILDMPLSEVGELFTVVVKIARAVKDAMRADGFNLGQNNGRAASQVIPHVHVHIIPRYIDGGFDRFSRKLVALEELRKDAEIIAREISKK
ncbi:MAG: HIT family protein [Nitrososphaerales archaeon]|nr:HIT family protein [Nitrososphaerales archaeon]